MPLLCLETVYSSGPLAIVKRGETGLLLVASITLEFHNCTQFSHWNTEPTDLSVHHAFSPFQLNFLPLVNALLVACTELHQL